MDEDHYLRFHGIIGKGAALCRAARRALDRAGWPAAGRGRACHARPLDRVVSEAAVPAPASDHQQFEVPLSWPEGQPNPASRVLGPSLRRLSADIQPAHGYPSLLAEIFVDVSRFRHRDQPKETFMYELTDGAAEALSRDEIPEGTRSNTIAPGQCPRQGCAACSRSWLRYPRAASPKASTLSTENRSDDHRRGPDRRLSGRDHVRPVRRPAHPRAARGAGLVIHTSLAMDGKDIRGASKQTGMRGG